MQLSLLYPWQTFSISSASGVQQVLVKSYRLLVHSIQNSLGVRMPLDGFVG